MKEKEITLWLKREDAERYSKETFGEEILTQTTAKISSGYFSGHYAMELQGETIKGEVEALITIDRDLDVVSVDGWTEE